EEGRVFDTGVDGVGIVQGGFDMPDALELPGMLGAVIPLMGGEGLARLRRGVVEELVALALGPSLGRFEVLGVAAGREPGLAAVVGALNDLSEPAAGL